MDLLFYARVLRKGWRLVFLCMLLGTAAAAGATLRQTPVYETSTKLFVAGQPAADISVALASGYLSQQRIASYADLVTSTPVVEEVFEEVGAPVSGATVVAQPLAETVILVVTVQSPDPQLAADVANAFGEVIPDVIERTETPPGGVSPIQASVSQPATVPTRPISPNVPLNVLLGAVLGLLIGAAVAVLRESLDTSVKSPEDLERAAPDVPLLAAVVFDSRADRERLVTATSPRSTRAESYRRLRTNVQFASIDNTSRSLVITSALPAEGKSTTSANLAIALAQAGQRVVLVEADLRRPALSEYLGVERAVGLTNVLIGQVPLADALQSFGDTGRLSVLAGGPVPPNPSEILGSQAMHDLVDELETLADAVIYDTPPLLPVTDAAVLASRTNGAIMVVRANRTSRDQVKRSLESLAAVGAPCIGVVLNFVRVSSLATSKYGYGYYADYATRSDVATLGYDVPALTAAGRRGRGADHGSAPKATPAAPAHGLGSAEALPRS